MNTDQAKQLSENALARLIEALEQGQSGALQQYLALMSRFHRYSWGNALMIYFQRPGATHVAGFHTWRRLGRVVRKGEKGIVILAPMVGKLKASTESESGAEIEQNGRARLFGFRAAHVFDVSQTEGEPLPEFVAATGDPGEMTVRLKEFVAAKGITLAYSATIAPAFGMSSGGSITLLPDMSPAQEFTVLAHEIAHELLHKGERRHATSHTVRETEAEAVAFVVGCSAGLDMSTSSADYIQLHSGDKETLMESLAFIQQTAAEIINAIDPACGQRQEFDSSRAPSV